MGIRKGESIPHIGDLLFVSDDATFSSEQLKQPNTRSRTFSFYYPETRPQQKEPRYSIVASSNANWADWQDLDEETYKERKSALIEETLKVLERHLPDIRNKIDHIEAATPRTIHHFTQHWSGASFGTKYEGAGRFSKTSRGRQWCLSCRFCGDYHVGMARHDQLRTNDRESHRTVFERLDQTIKEGSRALPIRIIAVS